MSKVSFRARQIDFNKPLPILKHGSELFLEISENALVNRGVPQIPSGMEKEEENEHHFVEVIQALQLREHTNLKIPVPEILDKEYEYKKLYHDGFVLPKQHIHIRTVYDYWLNKRVQSRQPLMYAVRQERRDGNSNTDPYVAFRRRSEKMQTRKNRKNDEQSYEKMLILRDQVDSLGYVPTTDPPNSFSENKKRSVRKRKTSRRHHAFSAASSDDSSEVELDNTDEDGPFAFNRVPGCRYLKPRPLYDEASTYLAKHNQPSYSCYSLTTVPTICHPERHVYTGYMRRRVGRGGRIIYDRIPPPSPLNNYFEFHDHELQTSCSTHSEFDPLQFKASPKLCWRPKRTKDKLLQDRLKTVVLNSHRGRPSFRWPPCTESFPIYFEHLSNDPIPQNIFPKSNISSDLDKCKKLGKKKYVMESDCNLSHSLNDNLLTSQKVLSNLAKSANPASATLSPTNPNISEGSPTILVPKSGNTLISTPQRLWRKLARPYSVLDIALQPSEFSKQYVSDVPFNSSNGIGPPTSENRLLLTDPSVLPPHKACCMARDCTSREAGLPGPQLQTANGVRSTQFFQLPI